MSDEPSFPTLTLDAVQHELPQLYRRIARDKGRVEIAGDGAGPCVLISKEELESLEKALEILADTDGVKAIEHTLARIARATARAHV